MKEGLLLRQTLLDELGYLNARVAGELLRLSRPQQTQYFPQRGVWEDGSGNLVLEPTVFKHARAALGSTGLSALESLLGLRVKFALEDTFENLKKLDPGIPPVSKLRARTAESATMTHDLRKPQEP